MYLIKKSTSETIARIAALGLLGGVLLSLPLWDGLSREAFPLLPLFGSVKVGNSADLNTIIQPYFTIALILCAGIFFQKKWLPALLITWMLLLCCLDLNRLQPWVWFYLLVFTAVLFEKKEKQINTGNALRWLLAGVYCWSGFNKLTPYFAEDNFSWFCEAFTFTQPFGKFPILGYAIALLEMMFAAGLLWERTRRYFRWIVIGFHGVIIIFLLKLDWNWVVIPWNLAMAAMVWVLYPTPGPSPTGRGDVENAVDQSAILVGEHSTVFSTSLIRLGCGHEGVDGEHSTAFSTSPLPVGEGLGVGLRAFLALIWLSPALCFFQLWPHGLSWQLYANTQPEATFYIESEQVKLFCDFDYSESPVNKMWQKHSFDESSKLLLDDWANDELRVPMFASTRTFRQIGKYLCRCTANPDSAGIYILTVNRWKKTADKMERIPCSEMTNDE